jgi:hypothetical protein
MAIVVGRMVAILEAQTAQFDARINAASQQLNRLNSTTVSAHRGVGLLRSGFQSLAFDGLSALPGPLGKVVAGFGSLVIGNTLVTGVLAMAGLVTTAWKNVAKTAEDTARRIGNLREQYIRLQDSQIGGLQLQIAGVNTPAGGKTNTELERRSQQLMGILTSRTMVGGASPVLLFRELTAIQTELVFRKAITNELEKQINLVRGQREMERQKVLDLHGSWINYQLADTRFRAGAWMAGEPPQPRMWQGPTPMESERFAGGPPPLATMPARFHLTPEFAQMMLMSMMGLSRGGAGGGLMALGGLTTGLSGMPGIAGHAAAGPLGWLGVGFSVLGSLIGNNADKNAEKVVKAIERMAREVGLERVTVVFTGPDGHQVRRSLAELEDSDAVERVPGPVGAQG